MKKHELRVFDSREIRAEESEGGKFLAGYAAVFNVLSVDLGGFREKIKPGAFAGSVGGDVRAFWSHNPDMVLGRTKAGTLELAEDEVGLRFKLKLPNTSVGNDAYESVSRGDVTGMSFGFDTIRDEWAKGEPPIRTLIEARLYELSPVAMPAYPQTDVAVRSLTSWRETEERSIQSAIASRRRRLDLEERA